MDTRNLVLLGNRALWGIITPNLRKISISSDSSYSIVLHFYYDKNLSELESELASEAETELMADFPDPSFVSSEVKVISYPAKISFIGDLIYSRYEPIPKGVD